MIENKDRIVVEWRDTLNNYDKEKEREIIKYFRKKYSTNNVRVRFNAIKNQSSDDMDEYRVEADENIYSQEHQLKLCKKWIKDNNISDVNINHIKRLDSKVESMLSYDNSEISNRVFKINWIEFRNFLSFDDVTQKIDYSKYKGLTTVRSNPSNYGGKTTAIVDLLLFLFFGKTTKTKTLDEIFNIYTGSDDLFVKGSIEIEGQEYVINRRLVRKKRNGTYTAKSKLDYYIPLPDGGYKNLNGEDRQKTDKIINSYIGNMEDFLLTIITTGDNLPDLVNATPTESGKIFTRFIGLDYFSEKETIAKKLKKEFIAKSNTNRYSEEELIESKKTEQLKLTDLNNLIESTEKTIESLKSEIKTYNNELEKLSSKVHNDIDNELMLRPEEEIRKGITQLENQIKLKKSERKTLIKEAEGLKPKKDFDVTVYNQYKEVKDSDIRELSKLEATLPLRIEKLEELKNVDTCPHCGKEITELDTDAISKLEKEVSEIKNDILTAKANLEDVNKLITEYEKLNEEHEEYSRKEIAIERIDVEISKYENSLTRGNELLNKYLQSKEKIELNKELETKIVVNRTKLDNRNDELRNKEFNLVSLKKDVESVNREIDKLVEIEKEIKNEQRILNIYNIYINLYGKKGISKMVLGSLIPLINVYLDQLLEGVAPFKLILKLNDKNEVEFITHNLEKGLEKNLISGSGYEKTVSALAIRTVLTKVCALPKPNMVAFDEVFGKVSEENLELLEDFFKRLLDYFDNVFIISHNQTVQDWGSNEIIIKKIDDKSILA